MPWLCRFGGQSAWSHTKCGRPGRGMSKFAVWLPDLLATAADTGAHVARMSMSASTRSGVIGSAPAGRRSRPGWRWRWWRPRSRSAARRSRARPSGPMPSPLSMMPTRTSGKSLRVRDQVVGEQARLHVAVLDGHVLGERVPEALHGRRPGSAPRTRIGLIARPTSWQAAYRSTRDLPGLEVHLHVASVRAERVVGERVALPGPRVERPASPLQRGRCAALIGARCGGLQATSSAAAGPPRTARRGTAPGSAAGELSSPAARRAVGRHRRHPVAQLARRLQDRVARTCTAGGWRSCRRPAGQRASPMCMLMRSSGAPSTSAGDLAQRRPPARRRGRSRRSGSASLPSGCHPTQAAAESREPDARP